MKILYLALSYILFLQFFGCKMGSLDGSHEPCLPSNYFLTKADWDVVPYKDSTELTFLDSLTNDTFVFYGTAWDSTTKHSFYSGDFCVGDIFWEIRNINFVCKNYVYPINFNYSTESGASKISIKMGPQLFSISRFTLDNKKKSYYIQNRLYNDVVKIPDQAGLDTIKTNCYYSPTFGIVKIETPTGNLELLKFK